MTAYQVWSIARADLRERTRRFSFLVIAALAVLAAFWAVPRPWAELTSITVDPDYFSQGTTWSWIPMAAALCTGALLPLLGFFYVKNALTFDRKTGTANLIFASSVSKFAYLAGKYTANLILLFSVLLIVAASSLFMGLVHFQGIRFSALPFLTFFASAIPGLFLCAAAALLLEAIPFFQTRMGEGLTGMIFLVFYVAGITAAVVQPQGVPARFFDITGFSWLKECIDRSVFSVTQSPAQIALFVGGSANVNHPGLPSLTFSPLSFSPQLLLEKACPLLLGFLLCIIAAAILPRREWKRTEKKTKSHWRGNAKIRGGISIEFLLTFRGCSLFWFLVMAALWFGLMAAPLETAQKTLWPLTLAWSTVLFSDYGSREKRCRMNAVIKTVFGAYPYQLLRRWFAGSITALFITAPVIWRTALLGEAVGMLSGIVFAMLIPALSIFLGEISDSERLFQFILLIVCYVMLNSTSLVLSLAPGETSALRCFLFAAAAIFMIASACFMRAIRR